MRILLTTNELVYSGALVGLVRAAEHLAGCGHEVTILAPEQNARSFQPQLDAMGIKLRHAVKSQNYDAAVVNTLFGYQEVLRLSPFLPVLWWIREGITGGFFAATTPAVREAFKAADKVLFNAPFLATDVYRSFVYQLPARRVAVIDNGIPPKPKDVPPAPKPEGTLRILCVASIYQRKRQLDLAKAVLALNRPDVECWLVGEIQPNEPGSEDLMAQIRQRPEIFHLTGPLPPREVHGLYASADVFCLPSGDESFGRAALEAAQHGLPAVLTDLPAYKDIWLHGWNALLYQAGDIRILAWMLRILIEDVELRRRLGEEARKTALRFGDGPTLAAVEAAIEEAVMIRRNG